MKKYIILLLISMLSTTVFAQYQTLEFYYIAHDRSVPVEELIDRLEYTYENALMYDNNAVIFYFPNFDDHIEVIVNLPGDNRDEFDKILIELRDKGAHDNYAVYDYDAIMSLISRYDFLTEEGEYKYSSVTFCWYVTPSFWLWNCNESLIAKLYFTLELDKYRDNVSTHIWYPQDSEFQVDKKHPFGTKNLCTAKGVSIMPY